MIPFVELKLDLFGTPQSLSTQKDSLPAFSESFSFSITQNEERFGVFLTNLQKYNKFEVQKPENEHFSKTLASLQLLSNLQKCVRVF